MKMQIREFAEFTGVSVRTLHYYDEIGLLTPAYVDRDTGYRFYDEGCLSRMQQILFYRELDFSLKSIAEILSSPNYDTKQALAQQRQLLLLKKERLERLIDAIDRAGKGEIVMSAFENKKFQQYKQEAQAKWGGTDAYREHEEKTKHYTGQKWDSLAQDMDHIMASFAQCKKAGHGPDSAKAQALVTTLQDHITRNHYFCSDQILACLGQMYVGDDRFRENIDRHGQGNAEFICQAIEIHCAG